MQPIKVAVEVSLAGALAAGRSRYGECAVELSDAEIASLSPAARALLRPSSSVTDGLAVMRADSLYTARLAVSEATPAAVIAALEARVGEIAAETARAEAQRAADRAREAQEREAHILDALARPDDHWIRRTTYAPGAHLDGPGHRSDPRIQALIARVEAGALPRAQAEWRAKQEAEEQRADAAGAERDAWIREHGSSRLQRALALGLVDTVERSYLEERLAIEAPGYEAIDEEEERDIREPSAAALDALEAARAD